MQGSLPFSKAVAAPPALNQRIEPYVRTCCVHAVCVLACECAGGQCRGGACGWGKLGGAERWHDLQQLLRASKNLYGDLMTECNRTYVSLSADALLAHWRCLLR